MLFSKLPWSVSQLTVQSQPCCVLCFAWLLTWALGNEIKNVLGRGASQCFFLYSCWTHPTGILNSCSCFFPRFQLGGSSTFCRLAVEGTDEAFILHLETCVHFKLECKPSVVNGSAWQGRAVAVTVRLKSFSCVSWGGAVCRAAVCAAGKAGALLAALPAERCLPSAARPAVPAPLLTPTSATSARLCLAPPLKALRGHWWQLLWFHHVVNINSILQIENWAAETWNNMLKMI